jgi:hypothetical protein
MPMQRALAVGMIELRSSRGVRRQRSEDRGRKTGEDIHRLLLMRRGFLTSDIRHFEGGNPTRILLVLPLKFWAKPGITY